MSLWGSIIVAVDDLYGNSQNQHGADAAQHGAQAGLDWTKSVYHDAQGNFAPYLAYGAGAGGLGGLSALMGGNYDGFMKSPDYMAARDAMNYGLDHSAAARGSLYSGGYLADLSHAQGDLASQYLGNYRDALFRGAGLGEQAASNLGSIGNGLAGNVQNGYNSIANAQQQRYDSNGQLVGSLGGLLSNYLQSNNQPLTNSSYGSIPSDNYGFGGTTPYGGYQDPNYGFGGTHW